MIGYHQPNLSAYRTLYNYACMLDSVCIMPVKLDSMHHVHALIMHFADFCSFNKNLKPICLPNSVIYLIKQTLLSSITIANNLFKTIQLP